MAISFIYLQIYSAIGRMGRKSQKRKEISGLTMKQRGIGS